MNTVKYSVCSISFRHQLVSLHQLIRFAHSEGYSGIELWGVHAAALFRNSPEDIPRTVAEMQRKAMEISMISDYLDLNAPPERWADEEKKWQTLLSLALVFRTDKIRIFAGNQASGSASHQDWNRCVSRLHNLARYASGFGIYTVIETHPDTLADTVDSTLRLIHETGHEDVKINLDFLHMWEAGTDPLEAYRVLKPWIANFHLKNVANRESLGLFAPSNVYSPNGSRNGMVKLAEGVIDYPAIIGHLEKERSPHAASIEWFGEEPHRELREEMIWLKQVEAR